MWIAKGFTTDVEIRQSGVLLYDWHNRFSTFHTHVIVYGKEQYKKNNKKTQANTKHKGRMIRLERFRDNTVVFFSKAAARTVPPCVPSWLTVGKRGYN